MTISSKMDEFHKYNIGLGEIQKLICYKLNYAPHSIHILKPYPQCDYIWR